MRLNKVSPRWLATCALAVALAVALCIPAVSLAADYRVSIRSGAPSVYTAQPVNVGGYVAPTAANKYVTMQYRKSGWPRVEVRAGQGECEEPVEVQVLVGAGSSGQVLFPREVLGGDFEGDRRYREGTHEGHARVNDLDGRTPDS